MGNHQNKLTQEDSSLDASPNATTSSINHNFSYSECEFDSSRTKSECSCTNDEDSSMKGKQVYPIMMALLKFVVELLKQSCGLFSKFFSKMHDKNKETIEKLKANVDHERTYEELEVPKLEEEKEELDEDTNIENMQKNTSIGSPQELSRGIGGGEELRVERFKVKMVEVGFDGGKGGGQVGTKTANGGTKK